MQCESKVKKRCLQALSVIFYLVSRDWCSANSGNSLKVKGVSSSENSVCAAGQGKRLQSLQIAHSDPVSRPKMFKHVFGRMKDQ